jgi:shikimate dehydrogenase
MNDPKRTMQPTGKTHLYAILAHPVAHVRAAEFYNPVFHARGIDAFLVPLHVRPEDLAEVVPRLKKLGNLRGLLLTIPHKEAMAKLCDQLGANGRLVGAVNTVRFAPDGRLIGDMFDGIGLVQGALASGIALKGRRVLLAGTGGAGRAVAFALAQEGVRALTLANRTASRAQALAADLAKGVPGIRVEVGAPDPGGHEVIINATSLGLHEADPLPVDPNLLTPMDLIEIIAAVEVTPLRRAATDIGCRTMGGRAMVDHQIEAQLRFFGETA